MKNNVRFIQFILLLMISGFGVTALADVKIKTRQTMQGQTAENTIYIKDKRKRTEQAENPLVMIEQCDLRRDITVMPNAKIYQINKYESAAAATPLQNVSTLR